MDPAGVRAQAPAWGLGANRATRPPGTFVGPCALGTKFPCFTSMQARMHVPQAGGSQNSPRSHRGGAAFPASFPPPPWENPRPTAQSRARGWPAMPVFRSADGVGVKICLGI
jgi:hypothetical protein